jgi:hypothetical protein
VTNLEGEIQKTSGNTSGLRTWIEYGGPHEKNELGWTNYRNRLCLNRTLVGERFQCLPAREFAVSKLPETR